MLTRIYVYRTAVPSYRGHVNDEVISEVRRAPTLSVIYMLKFDQPSCEVHRCLNTPRLVRSGKLSRYPLD